MAYSQVEIGLNSKNSKKADYGIIRKQNFRRIIYLIKNTPGVKKGRPRTKQALLKKM